MKGIGDEIVAKHDGRLVSAQVIERDHAPANLSFVQHVVMDEGGQVDQLDDGGDDAMLVREARAVPRRLTRRQAREQHKHGPQPFALILLDMLTQGIDGREITGELALKDQRHLLQLLVEHGCDRERDVCEVQYAGH